MEKLFGLATAIFTVGTLACASADTLVIAADEWCPYNCTPGSDDPGFMIEVAREALAHYGHDIDYQTLNWARSLYQAERGDINGVVGAVFEETPDFVFGPAIGTYIDTATFRAGEGFNLNDLAAHANLRLGAINGYEYYGSISEYIKAHRNDPGRVQYVSGENALEKNILKLVADRIDVVAEVKTVMEYSLSKLGMTDAVEIWDTEDTNDVFIAFSPALEESRIYANQLTEGVERLKASGRYDEIFAKYGVDPD